MRRWFAVAGLIMFFAAAAYATSTDHLNRDHGQTTSDAHVVCDLYVSSSGSDSASGQATSPLATLGKLDAALAPGQTGCLESGTYGGLNATHQLDRSGSPGAPITITSAPGQQATIRGFIDIEGSYTTVSGLNIDGSNDLNTSTKSGTNCPHPISNSLEINGHNDVFENNDFYQSIPSLRANGIGVGWNGQADNTIIRYNRIHDLGQCQDYDQIIYLAHGNNAQIYDNWMWNDPHGWGVQIYPGASDAHVHDNVIDGAGSGFVVGGSSAVSGNTIDHNIVINSTGLSTAGLQQGVAVSTCCGLGTGNSFTNNISYNNPGGIANTSGITLSQNTTTNPQLADPTNHDYRTTTDALATWGLWDGGLGALTTATTPTTIAFASELGTPRSPAPLLRHRHADRPHRGQAVSTLRARHLRTGRPRSHTARNRRNPHA